LGESSHLFRKTFLSFSRSFILVYRLSQNLNKFSFFFFRILFSFLRVLISDICFCSFLAYFNRLVLDSLFVRYSKVTSLDLTLFKVLSSHKTKVCHFFTFTFTFRAITIAPCCNRGFLAFLLAFESYFLIFFLMFGHSLIVWPKNPQPWQVLWSVSSFGENLPLKFRSFL